MKIIMTIFTICLAIACLELIAQTGTWGRYQGSLKWEDAKARCASNGMRLPSIEELKAAYKAKVTESWRQNGDGCRFWSSTPDGDKQANYFDVCEGQSSSTYRYHDHNVRCLR
jgi:hypothetical protein